MKNIDNNHENDIMKEESELYNSMVYQRNVANGAEYSVCSTTGG